MKLLWGAIQTALAADSTLVSLTGHSASTIRMSFWGKEMPPNYPYVAYYDDEDMPWGENMTTVPQKTRVVFAVFAETAEVCDNILTRLDALLQQSGEDEPDQYWDVSDANICNNWTYRRRRGSVEYDDQRQLYHGFVVAEFKWYEK